MNKLSNILYYIGLDIHKKVIVYCIKAIDGRIVGQEMIDASIRALDEWVNKLPGSWIGAMEATIFAGGIYDLLMEVGAECNKKRLSGKRYFNRLLETVEVIPQSGDYPRFFEYGDVESYRKGLDRLRKEYKEE